MDQVHENWDEENQFWPVFNIAIYKIYKGFRTITYLANILNPSVRHLLATKEQILQVSLLSGRLGLLYRKEKSSYNYLISFILIVVLMNILNNFSNQSLLFCNQTKQCINSCAKILIMKQRKYLLIHRRTKNSKEGKVFKVMFYSKVPDIQRKHTFYTRINLKNI